MRLFPFAAAALLCPSVSAFATPIVTTVNSPLSNSPTTVSFAMGGNTFVFTSADTGYGPGAAVATGGTGLVTSFFGGVSDFSAGSTINSTGELYSFSAFPTSSVIPYSAADDFIGLCFTLSDGTHFGYAEVDGASLVRYGYESTPGASIPTGAAGSAPVAATPEPSSFALLGTGLLGIASVVRKRFA